MAKFLILQSLFFLLFFIFECERGLKRNTWQRAHTLVFHTVTCGRVDRDGRAVIGGAVLPTTSGPRIRSCEHLPFAGKQHALPQRRKTLRRTRLFLRSGNRMEEASPPGYRGDFIPPFIPQNRSFSFRQSFDDSFSSNFITYNI